MDIITDNPLIEDILGAWQARIGVDYPGYRGHVYRMFNFCLALQPCSEEERRKFAIAACFHDIGLWSDKTVDYIAPSVAQVRAYLAENGLDEWAEEIGLMVEWHHKLRPWRDERYPLVERFRQADLVDFSLGLFRCGLPRAYIRQVKAALPNQGFHKFLLRGAKDWFSRHPLSPPPFLRW